MNNLIRWDPFKELNDLQHRLTSLLDRPSVRSNSDETITTPQWSPLVDITEDDKEYVIKAELPEVKKEDVKVSVENGVLSIVGERKFEKEEKGRRYHRVERSYGNFVRTFTLPDDADAGKVVAQFKDGVLRVLLAKREDARPRSIEVKVD
jgi:HSP20 family protein